MYKARRLPGGSHVVHRTTWEDEVAEGIVTGAVSVAGWALGAGISGLVNVARGTKDRRLASAIASLESASQYADDDRFLSLAKDFTARYPHIAPGHAALAEALQRKEQYAAALESLEQAGALGLDEFEIHMMRAGICDDAGMVGPAIQSFTYLLNSAEAREMSEIRSVSFLARAGLFLQIGDHAQAMEDANECIRIFPEGVAYIVRARVYRAMGDLQGALEDHTRAVQLAPDEAGAWEHRADVYEELGRTEEAAADRARAAKVSAAASEPVVSKVALPELSWAAAIPWGEGRASKYGGTLVLTADSVNFKPVLGIGKRISIPLSSIESVTPHDNMPPRLRIHLSGGKSMVLMVLPSHKVSIACSDTSALDQAIAEINRRARRRA